MAASGDRAGRAQRGRPRRAVGTLVGAALGAAAVLGGYLTYVGAKGSAMFMHPKPAEERTTPADLHLPYRTLDLRTSDGLTLKAWYVPAAVQTDRAVVFMHGYGGNKSRFLARYVPWLRERYNVLTFDFRDCGESQGTVCTLGHDEQKDVAAAISAVQARGNRRVALMGLSMGGALSIEAGAQSPAVVAVVDDCAYATLETGAIRDRLVHKRYPLANLGAKAILLEVDSRAGRHLEEDDPIRWVTKLRKPLFVIHGLADVETWPDEGQAIYAAAPGPKELWLVPGATHAKSYDTHPDEYRARVLAFLGKYL